MTDATTLFLIRHSSSVPDPGRPAEAWILSSRGRTRARQLVFGEETSDQALDRMHRAVSEIQRGHSGEPIAVVSAGP